MLGRADHAAAGEQPEAVAPVVHIEGVLDEGGELQQVGPPSGRSDPAPGR